MPPAGLTGRLAWSLGANVVASLTVVAASMLAARLLPGESFGRLTLLLSGQMVLTTLVASSLGQLGAKTAAEAIGRDEARLLRVRRLLHALVRGMGLLLVVAGMVAPPALTEALLGRGADPALLRLAVPALVTASVGALQQGLLTGAGAFRELAVVNVVRCLLTLASLLLLVPRAHEAGAVAAFGVAGLGAWGLAAVLLRRRLGPLSGGGAGGAWREDLALLTGFALPSWLSGALFVLGAWLGNLLLSRRADGLAEVGLFGVALQLGRSFLLFVPNALSAPFLVETAGALARGEPTIGLLRRSLTWIVGSALLPALVVAAAGGMLLRLYGQAFEAAQSVLMILLASTVLAALTLGANTALLAAGRAWVVAGVTLVWVLAFLGVVLAQPHLDARGLAWGYLAGYVAQLAATLPWGGAILRGRVAS